MGQVFSRIALTAGLAAVLSLPAAAATTTWQIDPAHSSAQFAVKHLMISTVRGAFTKVTGTIQFDDKDITKSTVDVTIDATSVDTRVARPRQGSQKRSFLRRRTLSQPSLSSPSASNKFLPAN